MKIKYRLSKIAIRKYTHTRDFYDIFEFSHYEYRIEKKSFFGWRKYMDNISDFEEGMRLVNNLRWTQSD